MLFPNSDFVCLPTFLLVIFFKFTCSDFGPFRTFEPKRSCVYAGQTGFAAFLVSLVQKQGKAECKAALGTINHVQ